MVLYLSIFLAIMAGLCFIGVVWLWDWFHHRLTMRRHSAEALRRWVRAEYGPEEQAEYLRRTQ